MNTRTANIISIIGIVLLGIYIVWMYPSLPDPMPTHWNASGEVDGYSAKPVGAMLIAGIPVLMWIIFKLIPLISRRGFRTESFTGTLNIIMTATVIFGCVIGIGLVRASHDPSINISSFLYVAIGLLFVIMGNFLGKVRKNFFLGIRTPWTLASDEVWARTHRLGGWCFVIAGIALAVLGVATPKAAWFILLIVAIMTLIPVVYSFILYRKIEGFASDPDSDEK